MRTAGCVLPLAPFRGSFRSATAACSGVELCVPAGRRGAVSPPCVAWRDEPPAKSSWVSLRLSHQLWFAFSDWHLRNHHLMRQGDPDRQRKAAKREGFIVEVGGFASVAVLAVIAYILFSGGRTAPKRERYQTCAWCDKTYWVNESPLRDCPTCAEKLTAPKRPRSGE